MTHWQQRSKLMSEVPGQSGHALPALQPPLFAKSGHRRLLPLAVACAISSNYSMTSSAMDDMFCGIVSLSAAIPR
jgi:hypothetical protein